MQVLPEQSFSLYRLTLCSCVQLWTCLRIYMSLQDVPWDSSPLV